MAEDRIVGSINRRLQIQVSKRGEWTNAKRVQFLDHLAATCNVVQSAQAAGMSDGAAHALRRRDPAFAELWSAALAAGYELLEAKLLAHALAQADPATGGGDPSAAATGPFDPADARLTLAQYHGTVKGGRDRGTRARPVKHATIEEVRTALLAKLVVLRKRLAKEGA